MFLKPFFLSTIRVSTLFAVHSMGYILSVPHTFQRFLNLLTIPNSPRQGGASFNERVRKNKKHRPQTMLYLSTKLLRIPIILGFYIVSIFAYLFGGGGGSRTPVRKKDQPSLSERSLCFGFRPQAAHRQATVRLSLCISPEGPQGERLPEYPY